MTDVVINVLRERFHLSSNVGCANQIEPVATVVRSGDLLERTKFTTNISDHKLSLPAGQAFECREECVARGLKVLEHFHHRFLVSVLFDLVSVDVARVIEVIRCSQSRL